MRIEDRIYVCFESIFTYRGRTDYAGACYAGVRVRGAETLIDVLDDGEMCVGIVDGVPLGA